MYRVIAALTAAMILLGAPYAHAQAPGDTVAAEQLFDQALELMNRGDFAAACPKLQASYKLDPATGTLLNLARCYENLGKLASAWGYYQQVADRSRQQGQAQRAAFAEGRARALEPKMARLTITVPESSRVVGLVVERGGKTVVSALFGESVYVDAGEYDVVARAPEHQAFSRTVDVVDGQSITVDIPGLEPAPERNATTLDILDTGDSGSAHGDASDRAARKSVRPLVGVVTGGVGLAAVAAGSGLGLWARSSYNDAFDQGLCDRDTMMCNTVGKEQTQAAIDRANIATVVAGVGLGLAITGAVLYLTAPRRKADERRLTVTARAHRQWLGITATGHF